MKNYSIVRIGNEYVVQADEKSVLKIASRRRAERTVTDAAELMSSSPMADSCACPALSPEATAEPSIACDVEAGKIPDPGDRS